jgi:hypothetical protein
MRGWNIVSVCENTTLLPNSELSHGNVIEMHNPLRRWEVSNEISWYHLLSMDVALI